MADTTLIKINFFLAIHYQYDYTITFVPSFHKKNQEKKLRVTKNCFNFIIFTFIELLACVKRMNKHQAYYLNYVFFSGKQKKIVKQKNCWFIFKYKSNCMENRCAATVLIESDSNKKCLYVPTVGLCLNIVQKKARLNEKRFFFHFPRKKFSQKFEKINKNSF